MRQDCYLWKKVDGFSGEGCCPQVSEKSFVKAFSIGQINLQWATLSLPTLSSFQLANWYTKQVEECFQEQSVRLGVPEFARCKNWESGRWTLPKSGRWGHWFEGWLNQSRWEELDNEKLRTQSKTGTDGVFTWTQDQLHGPVTQTVTQSLLLRGNLCLV